MTEPTLRQDVLAQNAAAERAYRDAVHDGLATQIGVLEVRVAELTPLALHREDMKYLSERVAALETRIDTWYHWYHTGEGDCPEAPEPEPYPQEDE
jgi:hypothetical protein